MSVKPVKRFRLDDVIFCGPTGHIGNTFSEHIGNTFRHLRETQNALEGVIQDGRADAVCRSVVDGEKMAVLCREFDISRKTGYKLFNRYKDEGLKG